MMTQFYGKFLDIWASLYNFEECNSIHTGDTVFLTIRVLPSFCCCVIFICCCCCCCCFWPYHYEACGILVPWPGIKPTSLHWKCSALTTGPPGTSPTIFRSSQHFYLFVKHLPSPRSAPHIIHGIYKHVFEPSWQPKGKETEANRGLIACTAGVAEPGSQVRQLGPRVCAGNSRAMSFTRFFEWVKVKYLCPDDTCQLKMQVKSMWP